jgi:hypothetical protein
VALSVNTVVERSYNHQINVIIARYVPSLAEAVTRTFALGEASKLQLLFNEAGFAGFETNTVRHTLVLPSFDAYYGPFERGGASTGRWPHFQRTYAAPYEKRFGATCLTPEGRSKRKPSIGLPVAAIKSAANIPAFRVRYESAASIAACLSMEADECDDVETDQSARDLTLEGRGGLNNNNIVWSDVMDLFKHLLSPDRADLQRGIAHRYAVRLLDLHFRPGRHAAAA